MRPLIRPVILALCVAVLSFAGGAYLYLRWCVQPLPLGNEPVIVEIAPGESLRHVAADFADKGIVHRSWDLVLYARLHEASAGLRAGEYRIEPGTTVAGLLTLLRSGKVVLHAITLVEGWNLTESLAVVDADPNIKHTRVGVRGKALAQLLGLDYASIEGLLLPDTYQFPRGTSDVSFLRRAAQAAQQYLEDAWPGRDAGLPYKSPYEALIMASIVEKETAQPTERGLIAGVFVRRLEKGMMLQTDPAVIYGLGDSYDGTITYKDLRTDTPYNTYTRFGLPPTPICMPSRASIDAALHPTPGKALYFVAKGDGTHEFSDTLVEQNAAVQKYQIKHKKPP